MPLQYMASPVPDRELKKGSAELMILALLEDRARHGYEIGQLIELRSRGAIRFNIASLYPLLYRLEKRNWIRGRWIEKPGQRRRRYYRLTDSGRTVLSKQRAGWRGRHTPATSARYGVQLERDAEDLAQQEIEADQRGEERGERPDRDAGEKHQRHQRACDHEGQQQARLVERRNRLEEREQPVLARLGADAVQ